MAPLRCTVPVWGPVRTRRYARGTCVEERQVSGRRTPRDRLEGEGGCQGGSTGSVDWTGMEGSERGRRGGYRRRIPYTYHGDCLCWLMATYVAHTSHYEAVLGPRLPRYLARGFDVVG